MMRTQISLTEENRNLLDAEAARTGKSISALIREAVMQTYGHRLGVDESVDAIELSLGAWGDRSFDGESYVDSLRSGFRLDEVAEG